MCEALEKLKKKGFNEGQAQMAVGMANMGMSIEQIAEIAKCDTKTVENWIEKSKSHDC